MSDRTRSSSLEFYFFFSSRRRHTRFDCDWSSDVCSSDLATCGACRPRPAGPAGSGAARGGGAAPRRRAATSARNQIGRASCRERVEISVVAVSLKKKKKDNVSGVHGGESQMDLRRSRGEV